MKNNNRIILILILISTISLCLIGCSKNYTLSFDVNGGVEISALDLDDKTTIDLPTPTREGYSFEGWYLTSDFSGNSITSITLSENVTIYAKWTELIAITLDLNGGQLSTTTVYGKSGDNVLDLVKELKPTKSGAVFGAWFIGNTELGSSTKLSNKGITLVANYKAEYVVNLYKQKLSLDGYDKEEIKDYAYIGKTVSYTYDGEGFYEVDKEDSKDEIVISNNIDNNILNIYLNREEYTVTLRSNYPDEEAIEETKTLKVFFGQEVELPDVDFQIDGYYLLGFATSKDSKVVYNAHFIDNLPLNSDPVEFEKDKISTNRTISLYAIWNKGYRDMFGGSDHIFLADNKVYLCRENIYFEGEYFESDNSFIFYNDKENLEGKLFNDGTFAYYNATRDEYSASLYVVGSGLDEDVKILFDAYNGITYYDLTDGENAGKSTGEYTIDENGYYVSTFVEGPLAGKTLTIVIGKVTIDNVTSDAFQLRNDEEYDLGELVRFAVYNSQLTYYTQAYQMILTGFGTLAYNTGNGATTYYYKYDKENSLLRINNSNGQSVGVAKIFEVNGTKGYMFYDESLDKTYTAEDGSTLKLDGICEAVYTHDGRETKGYYLTKSSAFGGTIVTFSASGVGYTFLTYTKTEQNLIQVEGEDDKTENVTKYLFELKPEGYAEYYYKDEAAVYYAPLVVINDKEADKASVYGYTQSKTFELVLEGTYVLDPNTNLYVFTTENAYDKEVLTSPFDIKTISSFVFALDTTSTNYSINYWYSSTIGEETTDYKVEYKNTDGSSLVLVGGIAILSKDGYVLTGTYKTSGGITTISNASSAAYVEIDEENSSFIVLEHSPYSGYIIMEDGSTSAKEYITFDGKGNGKYVYYVTENDEDVQKSYEGKVANTGETTKQGYAIYSFTSEEKSFTYLSVTTSSATFILPYYGSYYGTYTSNDGILYLDGYAYYSSYTDTEGNEYTSIYSIYEENVIRLVVDQQYRYFDIDGRSFSIKGKEYGTYIQMDNQGTPGNFIELDGYGKAGIFKLNNDEEAESSKTYIDENATYTYDSEERFTITYKEENKDVTIIGFLSTYEYNSNVFNTFVIEHLEVVQTFVNMKDWSVLKIDSIGNATRVDSKGNREEGTYMLITSSLLYYVNNDSNDANIYTYDTNKGTIVESKFTARGYYTEDLKSLLFSRYGFAIFNNETRYYYTIIGEDVIIYHQDASDPNCNEYGFIEENFGSFLDVKIYNGETYYANDGYAISFTRKEESKDKYPVLVSENHYAPLSDLVFTPSGGDEFKVIGSVKIDGTSYDCYVTREYVEDHYEMYVSVGYYRFDITAKYTGKDSEGFSNSQYEVIGLSYSRSFYPYTYLNNYYMFYMFYGASFASMYENNLGMFTISRTYDEEGNEISNVVNVEFKDGIEAVDLNGENLSRMNSPYSYENGIYTIELPGTDGFTYKLYLVLQNHSAFNMYAYRIYAITRAETIVSGDYTIDIERIIITDYSYSAGTIFSINVKKNGEDLKHSEAFFIDEVLHYVVREYNEKDKIIGTTYYKLEFVEKDHGALEEDVVVPYESATVTVISADTYYAENGISYIDVIDSKIRLFVLDKSKYLPSESEYDSETNTYIVTLSSGKKYKVSFIDEKTIEIEDYVEEENSDEE